MFTRITQNMVNTRYKRTVTSTMRDVSNAGDAVTNERKYQNDAEDPISATRAYQYRRELTRNANYTANAKSIKSLLQTRETVAMEMSSIARTAYTDVLGGHTDTSSPESRLAYSQQIKSLQQSAIQSLNTSYGDQFMFGGTSTGQVPFELKGDGTVTYRGVPVDGLSKNQMNAYKSYLTEIQKDIGASVENLSDEQLQTKLNEIVADGTVTQEYADNFKSLYDEYTLNMKRLNDYNKEVQYVNLGFGLEFNDDGTVNSSSAFNTCLNAIQFLGFGVDTKGNSKNMVQLLGDIADGFAASTYDQDQMEKLASNLDDTRTSITIQLTQLGADENFMDTTIDRLGDVEYNLTAKQNMTEYVDEAEAITNFQAANYAYKAALQVGSKILSQSFLDYMS